MPLTDDQLTALAAIKKERAEIVNRLTSEEPMKAEEKAAWMRRLVARDEDLALLEQHAATPAPPTESELAAVARKARIAEIRADRGYMNELDPATGLRPLSHADATKLRQELIALENPVVNGPGTVA
ncbi:MAG: hypothetical protein RJA59_418 [Pseudomonadota bacterium]